MLVGLEVRDGRIFMIQFKWDFVDFCQCEMMVKIWVGNVRVVVLEIGEGVVFVLGVVVQI